jgi:hypothetical protein
VFTIICLFIAPVFLDDEPKRRKLVIYEEEEEEEDDFETLLIKQRTGQGQTSTYTAPTRGKKTQ